MSEIEKIIFRKVFDSRGNPAVECDVLVEGGAWGRCSAPSGASVGRWEAVAYPKNVDEAIAFAKKNLVQRLMGIDAEDQEQVDAVLREVDGTRNFARLGGNVAVAVSIACAKAAARANGEELYAHLGEGRSFPLPLSKIIGGGKHAHNASDIQEFLAVPVSARTLYDAIDANVRVHKLTAKLIVAKTNQALGRDDESGWVAKLKTTHALDILSKACEKVSRETGVVVKPALDIAASSLFDGKKYVYRLDKKKLSKEQQIEFVEKLIDDYDLAYVEDPLHEEDFDGFAELTRRAGDCIVCGDDIFVTNANRLERGAHHGSGNAVIIKPNQIGTLTDLRKTIETAEEHEYEKIASHRSGETCDTAIAHIAVAFGCRMLKTNVVGGERNEKFNELIRIGEKLRWL